MIPLTTSEKWTLIRFSSALIHFETSINWKKIHKNWTRQLYLSANTHLGTVFLSSHNNDKWVRATPEKRCKIKNKSPGVHFWEARFIMDYLYDSSSTLLFNSSAYCATLPTFKCRACGSQSEFLMFSLAVCFSLLVWGLVRVTDRRYVGVNLHARFVNLVCNRGDGSRSFVHRKQQEKSLHQRGGKKCHSATGYGCVFLGHAATTDQARLIHAPQRSLSWGGTVA